VNADHESLRDALKRMPVPPLRSGFVDEALAKAVARHPEAAAARPRAVDAFARWETWMGAALGAAAAVLITVFLMQPVTSELPAAGITLAVNESRTIEVLIDSERTLDDATIRIAATGSVELDGFDDKRQVQWQTRLERGRNVLALPVIATTAGDAKLVAVIEHEGRTRRVAVTLTVKTPPRDEVA
jgi:hypothetical protein